jgi:hypothetical protein
MPYMAMEDVCKIWTLDVSMRGDIITSGINDNCKQCALKKFRINNGDYISE